MIAIVGAGLIGLSLARELAGRGATVRVFDTHEPGRGASWAGAGMLAPYSEAMASRAFEELCDASLAVYPAYVEELREASGIDPHLDLHGIVHVAGDAAEALTLRSRVERLVRDGRSARYLDRAAAAAIEPAVTRSNHGAALVEGEGTVDNRRLGRALLAACAAYGVRVETVERGVALEADARRVRGLRTHAGFVPAAIVVNAMGAWGARLPGVPAPFVVPVAPVKGQMLALAVPRGFVSHTMWGAGVYAVPRPDGRLLVGATVEDAGFDTRVTARGLAELLHGALAMLPAARDCAVTESWAGLRPGTPDGLPFLGATELEGYHLATGHYRNGILLAPITARLVADAIEGREPALQLRPFALSCRHEPAEAVANFSA